MEEGKIIVKKDGPKIKLSLEGLEEQEFLGDNYTIDDLAEKIVTLLEKGRKKQSGIEIDLKAGVVRHQGKETPLLAKEIKILQFFYKHPNEIISRKQLFAEVWENKCKFDTRTLDVHVSRLRKKLGEVGDAQQIIQTIRGIGYKFIKP